LPPAAAAAAEVSQSSASSELCSSDEATAEDQGAATTTAKDSECYWLARQQHQVQQARHTTVAYNWREVPSTASYGWPLHPLLCF
jgi:hypothetical protein